jgi:hypothetical protein
VFFLLNYIAVYTALFVLRRREPDLPRPYRAFGFPFSTGIVWLGCVLVLLAAIIEDLRSAVAAALLLIACAPLYVWISRQRRSGGAKVLPERRESCSGAALRGQSAAPIAVHRVDQDTKERPAHEHGDRKPRQQSEQNHAADERKGSHHPDERRPK